MRVTGRSGVHFLVAVLFPVTMVMVATALLGGGVVAEDDEGPTPPPQGDWNVTMDTVLDGVELNVSGDITVLRYTTLTIVNTTLNVRSTYPHQHELLVRAGASLHVTNSTLVLDTFVAETQSALVFEGDCLVRTRGRFLGQANSFFAEDTTFVNIAPAPGGNNLPGEDAVFIANGRLNSEFVRVTIENTASDATSADPGTEGMPGGASILISNITTWRDCIIGCEAGNSRNGGAGLDGTGGAGGHGADVDIRMSTSYIDGLVIDATASAGGCGANGAGNPAGDAGDGGNGGDGGNATVTIEGTSGLVVNDCSITVASGDGGSGGNGGVACDGDGGIGAYGADSGSAWLTVVSADTISITESTIKVYGGSGGYGGDYGRHIGGEGLSGSPAPAGDGGRAHLEVTSDFDIIMEGTDLLARGGLANDGGNGYEQGERGGDGGDAVVWVEAQEYLDAREVSLTALGGIGGNGGAAYSDIYGNGGDGGDARIVFIGHLGMDARQFLLKVLAGTGGKGNKPIYNGADGIPSLDLETLDLQMEEGTLNLPLDDLKGDARGNLYNVTFDFPKGGIHVLPNDNAEVTEYYPVIVFVMDDAYPIRAKPLVGWRVDVYSVETGMLVDTSVTDAKGRCDFMLPCFHYTSREIHYLGNYYIIATSPDGRVSKKVRGMFTEHTTIFIIIETSPPFPTITIERPKRDDVVLLKRDEGDHLDMWGSVYYEGMDVEAISCHLHPEGAYTAQWAVVNLSRDFQLVKWLWGENGPPEGYPDWGNFSHSATEEHRYHFCMRYDVFDGDLPFTNGTYILEVRAFTEHGSDSREVEFTLVLDPNAGLPLVVVQTPLDGRTFYGKPQTIRGQALDDWQLTSVEVRVDGGPWIAVNGTEAWTYVLETGKLADGEHEVTFRAFDGEHHSQPLSYTFWVDKPEDIDTGGGEDGAGDDDTAVVIVLALVVAILAVVVLLAALSMRRR